MNKQAVWVMYCLQVVMVLCLCSCAKNGPTPPPPPPLGNRWLLLGDWMPEKALAVGKEFDLAGNIRTGCYSSDPLPDELGGPETRKFSWSRSSGDTAALVLGKILNLGGALRTADAGSIALDTIVIRTGQNITPDLEVCAGTTSDGIPTLPGITALVGARSVRIQTTREMASTIAATLKEQGLKDTRSSADTTIVSFSGLRWLGVHLMGFEVTQGDTAERPAKIGRPTTVPNKLQVVVDNAEKDSLKVSWKRTLPGAQWKSKTVTEGELSVFAVPDEKKASGAFGLISVRRKSSEDVDVSMMWLKYKPIQWSTENDRNAAVEWINSRKLAIRPTN